MSNYAVVVLDSTGSMAGQSERVVTSMNEYVDGLPEDTKLTVFMFNSSKWETFYEGPSADWVRMEIGDYHPNCQTPLYDAVGKAIAHADSLCKDGDRVMMMIDTDGYENDSREFTQESINAMVESRKEKDWAFLFMASGLDKVAAQNIGTQAFSMGMVAQTASHRGRSASYRSAAVQTRAFYQAGTAPVAMNIDDMGVDAGDGVTTTTDSTAATATAAKPVTRQAKKSEPFWNSKR